MSPHPDGRSASLIASKILDRESVATYNLTIQAKNTEENKTALYMMKVVILDENDNGPVFPPPMELTTTIFSNLSAGTEIFRVQATDPDDGDNAKTQYYLLNYHYLFRVLPRTGTLILKEKIRIDRSRSFAVIIAARDGPHRTVGTVEVQILAVNEFKPFFENLEYKIKVSEAVKPGTSVIRVAAKDFDYGIFGALNFSVVSGDASLFHIDQNGVLRTSRSLFQLGGKTCTIVVSVQDRGKPPQKALHNANVSITIESIEKITFDLPIYHVTLLENTPNRSEILRVRAVPGMKLRDDETTERRLLRKSKDIVYSIVNVDVMDKFHIDRQTGQIITTSSMDYERAKEFR